MYSDYGRQKRQAFVKQVQQAITKFTLSQKKPSPIDQGAVPETNGGEVDGLKQEDESAEDATREEPATAAEQSPEPA